MNRTKSTMKPDPPAKAAPRGTRLNALQSLAAHLGDMELQYIADGETAAEWWTVGGYRSILDRALDSIRRHEERAQRVYGARAPLFSECLPKQGRPQ